MAYIGKTPVIGNFVKLDAITAVNGQAAYTMQNGGVNFTSYDNVNQFLVSLNGVLQAPTDSFTVSGSTLTFASNLSTGDVIDFVLVLGNSLDIGTPSDNTVTAAKLNNDIISGQTELASEPADTDEFLVSDAGTIKRIDYSLIKGGGITEADAYRLTANLSGDASPVATSNMERVDDATFSKIGTGVSYDTSNGKFTFGATGLYFIEFTAVFLIDSSADSNVDFILQGSSDDFSASDNLVLLNFGGDGNIERNTNTGSTFFNCTNTSTHKVRLDFSSTSTNDLQGSTTDTRTGIRFIRLGDSQ